MLFIEKFPPYIHTGGVAITNSIFGTTVDRDFILDDVHCTGNESNIFDCGHPLSNDCDVLRREEAGVICGGTCTHYSSLDSIS